MPIRKTELNGIVISQKDACFVLRTDDNLEHEFCGEKTSLGSRIQVTLSFPLLSFLKIEYLKTEIIRASDELSDYLMNMTLDEKLGQLMVIRTAEHHASPLDFIPGGYILFKDDFQGKSEQEIIEMTSYLKKQGAILMVDEEGGKVARVSQALFDEGYPSVQELYQTGGWQAVQENLIEKSRLLHRLGIDVNLNPVADVCEDRNAFIYDRSFGQNAEATSEYVEMTVQIQSQEGLISCLKHFPGYGNNKDTHTGFSIDGRSIEEYQQNDFLPFVSGIEEGAELVMTSHIVMSAIDVQRPVSLSKKAIDLLRKELNYTGLVITDDLTMDAIDSLEIDPLLEALLAGNDLLLTTDPEASIDSLLTAAKQGVISLNQIDESVLKVLSLKQNTNLFGNLCEIQK